jgi:hypothetical protein
LKFLFALALFSSSAFASDTYVKGYQKSDGTYVEPHFRSAPNNSASDNWSTKGNTNPYTGKAGTKSTNEYDSSSTKKSGSTYEYED